VKEFTPGELTNYQLECRDCWLERDKRYRYKVEAIDDRGVAVGASFEVAI